MSATTTTDITSIEHNPEGQCCDSLTYRLVTKADCDLLVELLNNSYWGDSASQGWANENELLEGLRITTDAMSDIINSGKYTMFAFFGATDQVLKGSVSLQHYAENKTAYISMFTVRPDLQARGYGKLILSVAEEYAVSNWNVEFIEMNVVVQRTELIAFYNRRGYTDTGRRKPYPLSKSIRPKRDDLEFCILRKCMKKSEEKISE